jgi:two-component system, cell cycle sensor histidine kinase and response regulator CckA
MTEPALPDRVVVLHLEDDPRDSRLIQRELDSLGLVCDFERVETEADFRAAIARGGFDLILADHSLPSFDALAALAIAREQVPNLPFICVSGSLGEELAIEALKHGATDYVLKQRLSRLAPAVRRALQEAAERANRQRAEAEVKDLEARLRQSQKLEAVGQLAGGIAHDFNNLLTVINGYCERLIASAGEAGPARHDLDVIHKAGRRAASLTSQLLAFSRRQMLQPRVIELNATVRDIEKLLRRVIGESINMTTTLDPALDATRADPGQIEQVLMNLAINARDAMPDGGTLTIATTNLAVPEDASADLPPGRYVQLSVRDTGHGMDEETLTHIFEPFFTTKEVGKGTGLGLPTVYGIVMQSGGHITVESAPNEGTAVHVYLPRVDPVAAASAAAAPPPAAARGHETLLLVEDEELVRGLVREFLESAGYTVIEAGDAETALRLVETGGAPALDMLVTDIVLPGMNGAQLAERLKPIVPGLKTLFVSGYPGTTAIRQAAFDPGIAFLSKPFSRLVLTEKVREILDADRRGPGTVLVLDDDGDIRRLLMSILTSAGYGVIERLEAAGPGLRVDAILADLPPGQATRLDTMRTLSAVHPGVPVILMAGAFETEVLERAREFGVVRTLQKPLDEQRVLDVVAQTLARPPAVNASARTRRY